MNYSARFTKENGHLVCAIYETDDLGKTAQIPVTVGFGNSRADALTAAYGNASPAWQRRLRRASLDSEM